MLDATSFHLDKAATGKSPDGWFEHKPSSNDTDADTRRKLGAFEPNFYSQALGAPARRVILILIDKRVVVVIVTVLKILAV